jgi:hypothetical protein
MTRLEDLLEYDLDKTYHVAGYSRVGGSSTTSSDSFVSYTFVSTPAQRTSVAQQSYSVPPEIFPESPYSEAFPQRYTTLDIDLQTPESAYATASHVLDVYMDEFIRKPDVQIYIRKQGIIPRDLESKFGGSRQLGAGVLGQNELMQAQTPYGVVPVDSTISLGDDFYQQARAVDGTEREYQADAAVLGVLAHEKMHNTIQDEALTRDMTRWFFSWFAKNYTQPNSTAYDQAIIAGAVGGAPLTPETQVAYANSK